MRNRQGLLLFVLWQQGDITPENHPPLPGKSPTPSVRGDLINCFSTLLLVGQKKPFFCIFGNAQYFHHLHFGLSTLSSLDILYSCCFLLRFLFTFMCLLYGPLLEFCQAQN